MPRDPAAREALELAKARAGNGSALAAKLGVKPQAVSQWDQVPAERVHDVERLTGVPRSLLRPDLYPPEREASAGANGLTA